ncbi:hypothetical protein BGW38_004099 [Lunasporangiospora selenospora]|uniref:Nitronate monooxygenase n=1 Tax=Lunasporangiospora selenospora TaxID=979761 RepID=A0A9P6FRU8_9FUNG|nr:hypothetical protein BGW38_004099 [Lunasporangiospora selenospora]
MLKDTDEFKDSTAKEFMPYGVGFITFWLDRQGPELLLSILRGEGDSSISHRPPAAVWFSFGDYRPYLKLIREHGAPGTRIIVQVQTVDEALAAQQDKVDVVVLQGTEAGGHGSQKAGPLINFIPEAKAALQNTLVSNPDAGLGMPALLAAGGISTAAQFKAAQALGADGVVIGTGFMPTFESPGPQRAKERLLQTSDGGLNTVKTRIFDELREFCWPEGFDGRVVRNVVTDREDEDHQRDHWRHEGEAAFKVLREDRTGTKQDWIKATAEQDYNILPLWSGTGVGLLKKQTSVAEFMDQLLDERA